MGLRGYGFKPFCCFLVSARTVVRFVQCPETRRVVSLSMSVETVPPSSQSDGSLRVLLCRSWEEPRGPVLEVVVEGEGRGV